MDLTFAKTLIASLLFLIRFQLSNFPMAETTHIAKSCKVFWLRVTQERNYFSLKPTSWKRLTQPLHLRVCVCMCVLPSLLSFHPTCSYVYPTAWLIYDVHKGWPLHAWHWTALLDLHAHCVWKQIHAHICTINTSSCIQYRHHKCQCDTSQQVAWLTTAAPKHTWTLTSAMLWAPARIKLFQCVYVPTWPYHNPSS